MRVGELRIVVEICVSWGIKITVRSYWTSRRRGRWPSGHLEGREWGEGKESECMRADQQGGRAANSGTPSSGPVPLITFALTLDLTSPPRGQRPLLHPHPIFQRGGAIALTIPHPRVAPRTQRELLSLVRRTWFQGTMPFNFPATLVPFYALLNPRLLLPSVVVVRLMHSWSSSKHIDKISLCSATFATSILPSYEMQATAV